jgi:hypothetical protein
MIKEYPPPNIGFFGPIHFEIANFLKDHVLEREALGVKGYSQRINKHH